MSKFCGYHQRNSIASIYCPAVNTKPALQILTGPTAVGKTESALKWALEHNAEILSCDSLLFYRGMNIGTAKPGPEALRRVPHHMIDIVSVAAQFSIKAYLEQAQAVVEAIIGRGRRVLIVGGSGFYLKSFFAPVVDAIEASPEIVARVTRLEQSRGIEGLLEELVARNPDGLGKLDHHNPRRVAKALQRCLASGRPLLELQAEFAKLKSPFADYEKRVTLLSRQPEDLWQRICARVEGMFAAGLLAEVEKLQLQGIENNSSAARAIGYRETLEFIKTGQSDLAALKQRIAINTRRLVAKQRKWFRNHLMVDRVIDLSANEF